MNPIITYTLSGFSVGIVCGYLIKKNWFLFRRILGAPAKPVGAKEASVKPVTKPGSSANLDQGVSEASPAGVCLTV